MVCVCIYIYMAVLIDKAKEHWGCLHFGAITNKAAVKIRTDPYGHMLSFVS